MKTPAKPVSENPKKERRHPERGIVKGPVNLNKGKGN